jgi:hypothetical protein
MAIMELESKGPLLRCSDFNRRRQGNGEGMGR